jgi:hypothetical protein
MEHLLSISRLRRLAQHEEKLEKTGLAGAIRPEEYGDGRQADRSRVAPGFEVLDRKLR